MIANFFRSLDRHGVEYLLISGQATVLYGAATFSEDIDLWLHPTHENSIRFLAALRECGARYYKLTPALTVENLARGHGFHFVLPTRNEPDAFLDIMGAPPRVGSFAPAAAEARSMDSEWGPLPTIGLRALVELKKTQRLEDYPIISKLAVAWFDQPECANDAEDFAWALNNLFTLPELRLFFEEHPNAAAGMGHALASELNDFAEQLKSTGDVSEELASRLNSGMQQRIGVLQQIDREYWRQIIAELKQLRSAGKLMPEGGAV
ncbi:MAG TPA: hypothetical protein VJS65_05265 [Verrucomicrobiae bacterium]|nr:hypothetical protein [Verrucomicrobiae bacterium]